MQVRRYWVLMFVVLAISIFISRMSQSVFGQVTVEQLTTLELYQRTLDNLVGSQMREKINRTATGKQFWDALTSNEEWMHDLMDSGPISNPQLIIERLRFIWSKDQGLQNDRHSRTLATAVALEYGRRKWGADAAWNRYQFYRDSYKEQRLHQVYSTLETWEKRYLTGHPRHFHGESTSQRWLRDNVKLPIRGYQDACWRIAYRSFNVLGDSVQGAFYYTPFRGSFASFSQMTIFVGGVCGRLSGFGTAAAVANGIPASTMGEPGHCAYAIRISRGKWVPCYSLSWRRGMHISMYHSAFSELSLFDKIFQDKDRLRESQRLRFQARLLHKTSSDRAIALFQEALKVHPIHVGIWTEYGNFLKSTKSSSVKHWKSYHNALVVLLRDHPETLCRLLNQYAYPNLLGRMKAKDKVVLFGSFHKNIKAWGPARWDFEALLNRQLGAIKDHPDLRQRFITAIAVTHVDSAAYGRPALAWASSKVQSDQEQLKNLLASISKRFSDGGLRKPGRENVAIMAASLIAKAQKSNDIEAYEMVGKLLENVYGPYPEVKEPPVPGKLISQGAFIRYSGLTKKYDNGSRHYWLGSSRPGFIHANFGKNVWISLELRGVSEIAGIQLDRNVVHRGRDIPIAIDVSNDGETWTEVHVVRKNHEVNNIDLRGKDIRGRFVRLRHLGKSSIHLKNIRVFSDN